MAINLSVLLGPLVGLGWFYHYIPKRFNLIKFKLVCLTQQKFHKTGFQMETFLSNPGILEQESEESRILLSLSLWARTETTKLSETQSGLSGFSVGIPNNQWDDPILLGPSKS